MIRVVVLVLVALALGACGERAPEDSERTLTRAQKDSVLAESKLPGAKAVGKAISISDSAAARAGKLDERSKAVPDTKGE